MIGFTNPAEQIRYTPPQPLVTWTDRQVALSGGLPATNDPRWVDVTLPFDCNTLYLAIAGWQIKNLLNTSALSLLVWVNVGGDIYQLHDEDLISVSPNRNRWVIQLDIPLKLRNFKAIVEFVQSDVNSMNVLSADWDGKLTTPANVPYHQVHSPVEVTFNWSKTGLPGQPPIPGVMGSIEDFDAATNTISMEWGGFTPANGTLVRVVSAASTCLPPCGLSYVADVSSIDQIGHTIDIKGFIPPQIGLPLRLRLPNAGTIDGAIGGDTMLQFFSSTEIAPGHWRVRLARDGNLLFIDRGSIATNRWIYLSYLVSPALEYNAGQLLYQGLPVDLFYELVDSFDLNAGSSSNITWTAHGLVAGDAVEVVVSTAGASLAGNYPANLDIRSRFLYVYDVINANTVRLCQRPGYPPVAFTSTGNLVQARKVGVTPFTSVTVGAAAAASFYKSGHGLISGGHIKITGTTLPAGYTNNSKLWLVNPPTFQNLRFDVAAVPNGIPVNFPTAGSGLTIHATNAMAGVSNPYLVLDSYWLANEGGNEFALKPSPSGTAFTARTNATAPMSLVAKNRITVSGKFSLVGASHVT